MSLEAGAAIVAAISAGVSFIAAGTAHVLGVRSAALAYTGAAAIGFLVATGFYWWPVWTGWADPLQFPTWYPIFMTFWWPAGALAAVAAAFIVRHLRSRYDASNSSSRRDQN